MILGYRPTINIRDCAVVSTLVMGISGEGTSAERDRTTVVSSCDRCVVVPGRGSLKNNFEPWILSIISLSTSMTTAGATLFWVSVALTFLPSVAARGGIDLPCPDPFADPAQDFCNPLRYIASDVLTGIAFGTSISLCAKNFSNLSKGLVVLSALIHTVSIKKWGGLFMLALVIGEYSSLSSNLPLCPSADLVCSFCYRSRIKIRPAYQPSSTGNVYR